MPAAESSHARRVLSSLNQQRAAGRFCDAVLKVGDGGCPGDGLELLLNFVYTGELKLDLDNLDKVQQAAASLCIPEALTICQQFKETSVDAGSLKQKRGRRRKCAKAVKEENLIAATDESRVDSAAVSFTRAETATPATTTRSGRVVKGPKRLVTVGVIPTSDIKRASLTSVEKERGEVSAENLNLAAEAEVTELQTDVHGSSVSQTAGEAAAEEGEEEDDVGDFEPVTDDTDEEYVPPVESTSSAWLTSASEKRKAQVKTNKNKSIDAVEEDFRKDSVQCPICHKSFKSKYYLKVHNRRHTGERPFGCLKCGKRYFRKENLYTHQSRDCARVLTYTCSTCSSSFNTKEDLRLHVVAHTGEMPHKCSTCNEQFMYKKNLTMHLMKLHGHPKPHACPQCPKTFLTRTELRVHEAAKHRGEKPFVCEECGHRASSRNGLQMHIKAIHRNERPFVCNLCGHAFSQKNNLNMHLRVHSGERPYQCHLCGKTFRTQASLDKHHRTHTGERPFSCDVCEQRFTEKGALLRHKASKHEEGRPHCCHICGKTFKAREQLRVHLRRHKGVRNFECIDCGYKFTRQAHLRRHSLIHKRTENYNPRQRKLRNVIVQDENEGTKSDYTPETAAVQESTNPQPDSSGLASSCIVRVVIEPDDAAMREVGSNQSTRHSETTESFSVPEVLQQTQLVIKAYGPMVDMEQIVEDLSENKA
ncbi:telomere zinc finger-associated protein isoform X2 [Melanotaenia boesemani]|uniref:telomere zinc finger-associated protein isoform X2 n=1 Tax=Melanotaenia boesemani TaxID=1250792 RepID=UPI001C0521A5|nr:telomere zinc finger-associated protein isoform X2 [Melanotaenia boesemani]